MLESAVEIRSAIALGLTVTLDDIGIDELFALQIIEKEHAMIDREQANGK